ncbi:FecR family protein [Gemmobacter serpentinus]|uniref:FecR family protein n=1 Tax=Gemmobacter serpentinus TaxID=2652247 RepID=UPI0018657116|nr:FecR family protein [Gemmobacter serpentinus]
MAFNGLRRALLAAPALLIWPRGAQATAEAVGTTLSVAGKAVLRRGDGAVALRASDPLAMGDQVQTGADGRAALELFHRSRIHLGPGAAFAIDRFVIDQGGQITLGQGAMVFDRADDLAPVDLTVKTGFARIGVRGTRFFAGPSKGVFAVFVQRGKVELRGGGQRRSLGPGEGADFARLGGPPGEVVTWGAARIEAAFASVGLRV